MKINVKSIGRTIKKGAKRIAPAASIMVGAAFTAIAAYKTAKAIPVAKSHIIDREVELGTNRLNAIETVKACGKDFAEPAIYGAAGVAAIAAGVFDYEKTVKNLGTTVSVASALLKEQSNEIKKTLGESAADDIQKKSVENVLKETTNGARIQTPGGSDIFIEEATGREYLSSEIWIRECFSRYMDEFIDNPDDRPCINVFYDLLAPNVKKSGAPIGNYLTFPYDITRPSKYNRVELHFEPGETVDGKAAFVFGYSRPMEYCYNY